ncbi:MAG: helix-turn-helix domain-containing protein [Bacillota bacterium]
MSQKQLNRFLVITKLIEGHITVKEASESLGLCERQILRLKKGVQEQGASFLVHKKQRQKTLSCHPGSNCPFLLHLI